MQKYAYLQLCCLAMLSVHLLAILCHNHNQHRCMADIKGQ